MIALVRFPWKKHLEWRIREVAYVARYSNGSLPWQEIERMEPDQIKRRADALNYVLSKENANP